MHEGTMTSKEIDDLRYQIVAFFQTQKDREISLIEAAEHFKNLGHTITRPIEYTLQAHGVVRRPDGPYRWPHPMMSHPWRVVGNKLMPSSSKDQP